MNILGDKALFFLIFISISCSISLSAECYGVEYARDGGECKIYGDKEIELDGVVSASPFRWPKNEKIDHYSSFTLHLERPICVFAGKDDLESAFEDIKNVEIGVMDAKGYHEIKGKVGVRVRCSGYLQPAISGYHVNSLILWSSECSEFYGESD